MDNTQEKRKFKWRLNLFDIIFIVCILAAAGFVISYFGFSGGVISALGSRETILYTIELQNMEGDTAWLPQPGDELIDRIEKGPMGTVVSVEVKPSYSMQVDFTGAAMVRSEVPNTLDVVLVVSAPVTITENQVRIGRLILRVGSRVYVNGPLYSGGGYITEIERRDAA